MAQNNLISLAEFQTLARPASVHMDESEVLAFVREAEDLNIKPLIGINTYTTLVEAAVPAQSLTPELQTLLLGGKYTPTSGCGGEKECFGLKRAVAYLAYARMIAANGGMVTRTGYYQHDDDYASRMDDKNRANARRDVQNMADFYLASCADYWATISQSCSGRKAVRGSLVRIKSIGHISE